MTETSGNGHSNRSGSHYLRVGDLARQTGKSVRAIHLYGEMGLLEPATRSSGGFRLYHPEAVERVRWIDLLNGLGFSLQDTRGALERWWQSDRGPEAMEELRALFSAKLDETRENIRRQQQLERELVEGLEYLVTCRVCGEPASNASRHCSRVSRARRTGPPGCIARCWSTSKSIPNRRNEARPRGGRLASSIRKEPWR
jgi:DNA-binding transcriptional MerR regulator